MGPESNKTMLLFLVYCHNPLGLSQTFADVLLLKIPFFSPQSHHNLCRLLVFFDPKRECWLWHKLLPKQDSTFNCYRIRQVNNRCDETQVLKQGHSGKMTITEASFFTWLTQVSWRPLVFTYWWSGGTTHHSPLAANSLNSSINCSLTLENAHQCHFGV